MNENIKKLLDQVDIKSRAWDKELEEFAELIVRECATVCRDEWVKDSQTQRYGDQCANSIEYHFNIKEKE